MDSTVGVVVVALAAAANGCAAMLDFARSEWVLGNMRRLKVPATGLQVLGALKLAGAVGLLAGLAFPVLGAAAAAGLCLFFAAAVAVTLRARWYAHLPYPAGYLLLSAAALAAMWSS